MLYVPTLHFRYTEQRCEVVFNHWLFERCNASLKQGGSRYTIDDGKLSCVSRSDPGLRDICSALVASSNTFLH